MRWMRKAGKLERREENQPCFYSNHTCEPAAVTMETKGSRLQRLCASQGETQFLTKKIPFDKNKEKIRKSHPLWVSGPRMR